MTTATYNDAASELVRAVCSALGVDVKNVRTVTINARGSIDVEVYELNDDGAKFIRADGNIALGQRTLQFRYE